MSRENAIQLLDRLAELPREQTPTIDRLLSGCPDLAASQWINCYGPAPEWNEIAARYATPALAWLIRVLVIAERELKWGGGSVAAAIWLFRTYQQRADGNIDELDNWILLNRGNNDYLPFGSMTSARSLDEWRVEQTRKSARRAANAVHQKAEAARKLERAQSRQDEAIRRKAESGLRKQRLQELIKRLEAMVPADRLETIAYDATIPLGALPESLIYASLDAASQLENETRVALNKRIDRRQSGAWRELRKRLTY